MIGAQIRDIRASKTKVNYLRLQMHRIVSHLGNMIAAEGSAQGIAANVESF
ncbi:hypothetical protein [Saccharopolyspora terrae]|uniref:hypothetical protein n=1 Tax=Saccharopolyspora terrae TaxID=2530384 RepID=UPI0014044F57|nr:hypothetical protein [Saccharopolyspora terrae]